MRITKPDMKSLNFACIVLSSLAEQTIDDKKRKEIKKHRDRIRKCSLILLTTSVQGVFDAEAATLRGIPDNSVVAKGINTLCNDIENSE